MRLKTILLALIALNLSLACGLGGNSSTIPANTEAIDVAANTSLTPWLTPAIEQFNAQKVKTAAGKTVYVTLIPVEAGQFISDITSQETTAPDLWIPDAPVWVETLAQRGDSAYQSDCVSTAQSPLVIAMWQPIAEALGWPGRSLGWLDISSLAADPSAWAYYSGGQFGETLKIGHTHPGLSGSGTSTLLAIVQAAQAQSAAVTTADIQKPIVQASVSSFESTVSWFSPDTEQLGQTMRRRGPDYLGAAIVYESTVLNNPGDPALVPIYPFEGTFVATHPACLNRTADPTAQEAATLFRNYLLGEPAQQLAVAAGLRPVNPAITTPGIDPAQPAVIFNQPNVETVFAVQDLWQTARKAVNLVMLLDTSGSMAGNKMEKMRQAAGQFVQQMGNDDFLSLIIFLDQPVTLLQHQKISEDRAQIIQTIETMQAGGGTALYDAIGAGTDVIAQTTSSNTTNVLVVLTDGKDTASHTYEFNSQLMEAAGANNTTIFTIAYGTDADEELLAKLAAEANGNFYRGTDAGIAAIYQEMSAAFGGSAGIGR